MNPIVRNSFIMTVFTAIAFFVVINFPQYFSYCLIMLAIIELVYWVLSYKVRFNFEEIFVKSKFLILPFLFNIGFIFFLAGIFSNFLKYFFLVLVLFFNFYLFIALKRIHNLQEKAALFYRNVIVSSAFFTILFSLAAIFRFYVSQSISASFRVPLSLVVVLTIAIFYVVSYFLAFENGVDLKKFNPYLLVMSLLGGELALVSLIWVINYPVYSTTERGNLSGLPLPAILLTVIFYFVWGVFSHKIDKSLTKRVIIEYILFTLLFSFILLITAKWLPNF